MIKDKISSDSLLVLFCIVGYYLINQLFSLLTQINPLLYFENSILISALSQEPKVQAIVVSQIVLTIVLLIKTSWAKLAPTKGLKFFICFVTFVLAYVFSSYDFNLYFNQAHTLDRLVLVSLAIASFFHPAFLNLFIVQLILIAKQFDYPVFEIPPADKRILFDVLMVFVAYQVLSLFLRVKVVHYLFVVLCFVASNYFYSGLVKMLMAPSFSDWVVSNDITSLFINSTVNGWLSFLSQEKVFKIADLFNLMSQPIMLTTLVIEFGAILIFLRRQVAYVFLLAFCGLHLAIFVSSGIFFWKWILCDLVLLICLLKVDEGTRKKLFSQKFLLLSLPIILFSKFYFSPYAIGWFDTKLNGFYKVEVIDETNHQYEVPRMFMTPYDLAFAQNQFYYLHDYPRLTFIAGTTLNSYGIQNAYELSQRINAASDGVELEGLKKEFGVNFSNEQKAVVFMDFLGRYFSHLNQRLEAKQFIKNPFSSKHIFYTTTSNDTPYHYQSPITKIRIRFIETFADIKNRRVQILDSKIIREIQLR